MDLGAMAVCADWENVNGLNPLLHEPSEPSEPPVVKTSPERLTRALHPAPIEDAYHGAVFGNLGIALPCADRRLRHRPFARTGQAKTPRQQAVVCPECKMVAVPIQGRQVATQKLHFKEKPFKCPVFHLPHRMRSPFSLNESPPMSKSPCPDTRRPLADSSSTVHRDATCAPCVPPINNGSSASATRNRNASDELVVTEAPPPTATGGSPPECPRQLVLQVSSDPQVQLALDEEAL